jgi:DNA-binding MurR/RpiR family transcriptional regulator
MQLLGAKIRLASDAMLLPEYIGMLSMRDAVIAISFPRYSRRTIEAAEASRAQGARVVAITNSGLSPLSNHAHVVLPCPFVGRAFQNSQIAAYALADLLIEQVVDLMGSRGRREIEQRLKRSERLLRRWGWLREIDRNGGHE